MARVGELLRQAVGRAVTFAPASTPVELRSPWTVGQLSAVVASDVLGTRVLPMTREVAMSVPAVSRCRHLLAGSLASSPLVQLERDAPTPLQPAWLSLAPGSTAWHRMVWTLDDLFFSGWSLWAVERDGAGALASAVRVPAERWSFDRDGTVLYIGADGTQSPASADSVLLIPGPHEGLLSFAARTITTARVIEETVSDRASNPVPVTELSETEPDTLTRDEVTELLGAWRTARREGGGAAVGFTPHGIALNTHGTDADAGFLIEARNAASIDIARHSSIPAAMIDASNVNASLTYETTQGRNLQYVDQSVSLYAGAIAARLSEDDASPPRQRVSLDTSALTSVTAPPPTGTPRED